MTADPGYPSIKDRIAEVRTKVCEGRDKALKDLLLDADLWTKEGLFRQIKILFEDQPEGDNIPEQYRQDAMNRATSRGLAKLEPKDTCQTCGGSRVVDAGPASRIVGYPFMDCPDCYGTEEEKKYCLRCGVVCSDDSVVSCYRGVGNIVPGEQIGKHRWTNERSGVERRSGEEKREGWQVNYNDRRGADRRSGEDRRKAGSG